MTVQTRVQRILLGVSVGAGLGLSWQHAHAGEWRMSSSAPKVSVTAKVWESTGNTKWSHNASFLDPVLGNPTSRLQYQDLDSTIVEIAGHVDLPRRFYLELAYGAGNIDDGTLLDDDFLSALGADLAGTTVRGEHMFSRTLSSIDGDDLHYYQFTLGREVFRSADARTRFGVFGQYLDWSENYVARGVVQQVCTAPNVLCPPAGFAGFAGEQVISDDVGWQVFSVGVDAEHRFGRRFAVSGRLTASPHAELDNRDIHLLRPDLGNDPSFRMQGTGWGYTADVNATYYFTTRLAGHLGLRYWKMRITNESGGWQTFPVDGPPFNAELNEFETERKGVTLGISYTFGGATESHAAD